MTASLSINGIGLTGSCARVLLQGLTTREIDLATLDPRIPPTMEKRGFATIEATCLRISPRGMEIAKALQAKGWEPEPLKRGPKKAKTVAHEDTTPQDARSTSDSPTRGASKHPARKAAGQSRPSNRSTASPRPSGTPRRKDSPPPHRSSGLRRAPSADRRALRSRPGRVRSHDRSRGQGRGVA